MQRGLTLSYIMHNKHVMQRCISPAGLGRGTAESAFGHVTMSYRISGRILHSEMAFQVSRRLMSIKDCIACVFLQTFVNTCPTSLCMYFTFVWLLFDILFGIFTLIFGKTCNNYNGRYPIFYSALGNSDRCLSSIWPRLYCNLGPI